MLWYAASGTSEVLAHVSNLETKLREAKQMQEGCTPSILCCSPSSELSCSPAAGALWLSPYSHLDVHGAQLSRFEKVQAGTAQGAREAEEGNRTSMRARHIRDHLCNTTQSLLFLCPICLENYCEHVHACVRMHVCVCVRARVRSCNVTYIRACIHACACYLPGTRSCVCDARA